MWICWLILLAVASAQKEGGVVSLGDVEVAGNEALDKMINDMRQTINQLKQGQQELKVQMLEMKQEQKNGDEAAGTLFAEKLLAGVQGALANQKETVHRSGTSSSVTRPLEIRGPFAEGLIVAKHLYQQYEGKALCTAPSPIEGNRDKRIAIMLRAHSFRDSAINSRNPDNPADFEAKWEDGTVRTDGWVQGGLHTCSKASYIAQRENFHMHQQVSEELQRLGYVVDFFAATYNCTNGERYTNLMPDWYGDQMREFCLVPALNPVQFSQPANYEFSLAMALSYELKHNFKYTAFMFLRLDSAIMLPQDFTVPEMPVDGQGIGNGNEDVFEVWPAKFLSAAVLNGWGWFIAQKHPHGQLDKTLDDFEEKYKAAAQPKGSFCSKFTGEQVLELFRDGSLNPIAYGDTCKRFCRGCSKDNCTDRFNEYARFLQVAKP
jgi:hypothetical protein